jgi:D-threo-aldose 1-dehydrogenase
VRLSDLVFGCGPVGSFAADGDLATGRAALAAALAAGIRSFDVAPSYGAGRADSLLRDALRGIDPASVTVSTKVGRTAMATINPYARPVPPGAPRGGGAFDFSSAGVRATLATSLTRLGLDRVAVAFLHDPELASGQAAAEALPALAGAREDGLIGAAGVATTDPATALRFVEGGAVQCVMIAAAWTLTRRTAAGLLDRCAALGIPVHAAGPFDSGLLATARPRPAAPSGYRAATPAALATAHALADICERHGVSLPQAAIQFPLRHPAVTAVVAGMRSPADVAADVALLAAPVGDAVWEEIDDHLRRASAGDSSARRAG